MHTISTRILVAALVTAIGCGQADPPAKKTTSDKPATKAEANAKTEPEAEAERDAKPAAALPALRAVGVQDKVVACHAEGKTFPGAQCPAADATLLSAVDPGKPAPLTAQPAKVAPGACGYGAVSEPGTVTLLGDTLTIESLPTDGAPYRALIAPAVGIADPTSPGFVIDQLFRVDLNGDGTLEVLFSAQQKLGLRRVVADGVETVFLPDPRGEEITGVPKIVGLADLDGDGTLEIIAGSGDPLKDLGPQWTGHWVIAAGQGEPSILASAGCDQQ